MTPGSGARLAGIPIPHNYDPLFEEKFKQRKLAKFAPQLHHLVYGKRYILPGYRQADYYSQPLADALYLGSLIDPMVLGRLEDDVANCAFTNCLRAMACGRPRLWLESELAEAFMRTQLPGDFQAADIKWRWPGMRIYLPRGILRVSPKEGARQHDLMYLDICHVPLGQKFAIPEPYKSEIRALGHELNWRVIDNALVTLSTTEYTQTALMISGNLDGPEVRQVLIGRDVLAGDLMLYGVVKPFDDVTLQQIAVVTGTGSHLSTPYEPTEEDDRFCERMLHMALQILLYLGSMPLEYQPETILRKAKLEGKHAVPALLRARFVGQSQLRAAPAHAAEPVHHTGRHLPAHWVAGHWKRQVHGPKLSLRKLVWIQPYQTYGTEEEKHAY